MNAAFASLAQALDAAADAGHVLPVWWRDDDAVAPSAALDRLLGLAAHAGAPVSLAIIPAQVDPALPARLARQAPIVSVLVHGHAHTNHAPADAKKAEFGDHRPPATMADELGSGLVRLRDLFGPLCLPVFVPPWNRIGSRALALLPAASYRALSGGPKRPDNLPASLAWLPTDLDPIDWHGGRDLREGEGVFAPLLARLAGLGAGTQQPFGILTHHRVHAPAVDDFLAHLISLLASHPAIRFLSAATALGCRSVPSSTDERLLPDAIRG